MQKKYQKTLHGRLLLIILITTLPTIIFTLISLSYLIYIERQHSVQEVHYRSYFSKGLGEEVLKNSVEVMNLLEKSSAFEEQRWQELSSLINPLIQHNDLITMIMIFDKTKSLLTTNSTFSDHINIDNLYNIKTQANGSVLLVGKLITANDEQFLPLALQTKSAGDTQYYVVVLLDWQRFLSEIFLNELSKYDYFMMKSRYLLSLSIQNEHETSLEVLADSEAADDLRWKLVATQQLESYEVISHGIKHTYLIQNEVLINDSNRQLMLSIGFVLEPWYRNLWYIIYVLGVVLVLLTLIGTFVGYFLLKKIMMRDIKDILGAVESVAQGNFVVRAKVKDEEALGLLASGINQMAALIAQQTESLTKAAHTDELTGLYNRRYFLDYVYTVLSKTEQQSIILFDIDYFKLFNDTYGHKIGDAVLIHVAQLVKHNIRQEDVLARYGGEEFIIFLQNTDAQLAMHMAEKIRYVIHHHEFDLASEPLKISVSLGVAHAWVNQDISLDELIINADIALYQAKRGGRNQVILFGDFKQQKATAITASMEQEWEKPPKP